MPRSIFAMRSWWRRIIVVMAIAPPTRIATIGTSNPPKLVIESTNLIRCLPACITSCACALTQRWSFFRDGVRINPLLDESFTLPAGDCHFHQLDDSSHAHERQGNHQNPPTPVRVPQNNACHNHAFHRTDSRHWIFLVELTGIEPVASWLQTRRSPS